MRKPKSKLVAFLAGAVVMVLVAVGVMFWEDIYSRLFLDPQAIQHAHQKAIIHRDIKPSNVLVTMHDDKAVPKVNDFGIAKATQAELTTKTIFTQFQQFIGTPAYMSPEQAQMSGLDLGRCMDAEEHLVIDLHFTDRYPL